MNVQLYTENWYDTTDTTVSYVNPLYVLVYIYTVTTVPFKDLIPSTKMIVSVVYFIPDSIMFPWKVMESESGGLLKMVD